MRVDISLNSDFLQKIYFYMNVPLVDLSSDASPDTKLMCFVSNLGHSVIDTLKLLISAQPQDVNTCENLDYYYKTFLKKE